MRALLIIVCLILASCCASPNAAEPSPTCLRAESLLFRAEQVVDAWLKRCNDCEDLIKARAALEVAKTIKQLVCCEGLEDPETLSALGSLEAEIAPLALALDADK